MSVRANVDNKFIRRYMIIAIGGLAFMLWGAYDAFVAFPKKLEMAHAFAEIKDQPDYENKWLALYEKNKDKGWTRAKPTLMKYFKTKGTWMESTDKGISTSWGKSVDFDQITKIDKRKWEKKGIAKVHFKDEVNTEGVMVFDDFKYDRSTMSELMSMCEKGLKRDQIVNGKSEAEIAIAKAEEEKKKAEEEAEDE